AQDLVHHRRIPRVRQGVGHRRPRPWGQRRRHRAGPEDARRPRAAVRRPGPAPAAGRGRPRRRVRRRQGRPRPVRPAGRRRQQRRLRTVRDDRGDLRGRGPRPVRHQRVRRALRHPGRAALPPRAGLRPHPAGQQHRRHQRLPEHRHLQRLQVGPRGVQPVVGRGGRRLRHQGHPHRARRVRHRLGRLVGEARHAGPRLRRLPREGRRAAQGPRRQPRRTAGHPRGGPPDRGRRRAAAPGLLRQCRTRDRRAGLRVAVGHLAHLGAAVDRGARPRGL
ncbi:MAG: Short-chain dehydrogenase/reductase SDR, partial [uncultured Blastococcus sp.]